ncbi:MAG TPA: hypothetical protein VMW10_07665, partial [Alphaproteobacteria bacterium]|nr:hypothetical protein [Alphaproteobacteria bacterium]
MLKKLISYLIIFSILFVDGARCMEGGDSEEKRPLLHRRCFSDGDVSRNSPSHLLTDSKGKLSLLEEGNAAGLDGQPAQPFVLVSPPKEDEAPSISSEGDEGEAEPHGRPLVVNEEEEEDEDGFVRLPSNLGSQVGLSLLGRDSPEEDSQIDETSAQKYLRILKIKSHSFTLQKLEDLDEILKNEGSWKNGLFVWENFRAIFHKLWFALTTDERSVNKRKQKTHCKRLWLYGGPIPLDDNAAKTRNIISKTFGNSLEEGVIESLHATLYSLLGYQLYETIRSGQWAMDWAFIANFYRDSDTVSYLGIIKALNDYPALFAVFGVPLVYATLKTFYNYSQISEPTDEAVWEDIDRLKNRSHKWDSSLLNVLYFIPLVGSVFSSLHPLIRKIPALASLILWEGKLPSETRENAFTALLQLARERKGPTKMAAIEALSHIAHALHTKNLHLLRRQDAEELLSIKLRAFRALKEIYGQLSTFSLNKFLTAALLWGIGYSPSWLISIVEPINKTVRGALYGYTLYGIIDVLYKYFTCPVKYLKNFTWDVVGGLPPAASKYSEDCFTAQVKAFNTLPGQPASTLVGKLTNYNFRGPYALDLSNKGIEGPVLAEIVEGFQKAKVPLRSLDVSFNAITNSSDIARILGA